MSVSRLNVLSDVVQALHGVPLFLFASSHHPPQISKTQSRHIPKVSGDSAITEVTEEDPG